MPRRGVTGGLLTAAVAAFALLGLTPLPSAQATVPVIVLDGTGYGHGVGLSQWGAEYLARQGQSAEQILATFYPGAVLAEATGPVRVAVHQPAASTTTLTFPQGGEVRSPLEGEQAPGFPLAIAPGGRVRITFDGAYRVEGLVTGQSTAGAARYQQNELCELLTGLCPPTTQPPTTTTTTAPGGGQPGGGQPGGQPGDDSTTTAPPPPPPAAAQSAAPVWAVPAAGGVTTVDDRGRSYRGVIEATGAGAVRLVNHIGVEDYLRGMAEVPGTWPAAAVQAQTVAARTYALRSVQASGEICDDARCQVYRGATAESPGQDAAVAATARRVLAYNGSLAAAVYSADAGGVSATTLEGFGTPDGVYPYLTTVHYETDNPLPWRLQVGLGDLGARLGYPGTVTDVRVAGTGPSGRAMEMVLEGTAGEVTVDGRRFARSLGLRSTRFTASLGRASSAPAPPPAEEAIQALPEETAEHAKRPARPTRGLGMDRRLPTPTPRPIVDVPPVLDPRRELVTLVAIVLLAGSGGAHLPLLLTGTGERARRPWPARSSPPWRRRSRDR